VHVYVDLRQLSDRSVFSISRRRKSRGQRASS